MSEEDREPPKEEEEEEPDTPLTPEELEEKELQKQHEQDEYESSIAEDQHHEADIWEQHEADEQAEERAIEEARLSHLLRDDFVGTWKLFLDYKTDAHWSYKEITGLYLISALAFTNWRMFDLARIPIATGENFGGMWLNLWIMLLGESRIARKSTVIKATREMLKQLTYAQEAEVAEGIVEEVTMILPHEFNPASFVQIMNHRQRNEICYATWIDDEVSRFYEQMDGATYMSGIAPALSKLYDPEEGYSRATIARGTERIARSYLTILTASTMVLPQLFNEREIMQGFLNRFMFLIDDPEDRIERRTDRASVKEAGITSSLLNKKMLKWLKVIRDAPPYWLIVELESPGKMYYDEYERHVHDLIRKGEVNQLFRGYLGNLPDFLMKIAALYRISRTPHDRIEKDGYYNSETFLKVELQDFQRARKLVDYMFENFKNVVRISRKRTKLGYTFSQDSNLITVYESIERHIDMDLKGFAMRHKVIKTAKMKAREFDGVVATLEEIGSVEIKYEKRKGGGKPIQLLKPVSNPI